MLCHKILVKSFVNLGIFKSDNDEKDILNSGITAAFFPHGVGHSLGLDVHDVPDISKPADGTGKSDLEQTVSEKAAFGIYRYLRLRLTLRDGMVVVSILQFGLIRYEISSVLDRCTWDLLLSAFACSF